MSQSNECQQTSTQFIQHPGKIDIHRIAKLSSKLNNLVDRIKQQAFLQSGAKLPPTFNNVQLAKLCQLNISSLVRKIGKAPELGLPVGNTTITNTEAGLIDTDDEADTTESRSTNTNGPVSFKRRTWTLAEARTWVKSCGIPYKRPPGVPGAVITIANFKGGVGKTFTSMSLAQGLSLMGYKVLAIDVDPQGSMTSLFGILPTDVADDMTILPMMLPPKDKMGAKTPGARPGIKESIRKTYWDGLDLVAGSRSLFNGEFYLPSRQLSRDEANFDFYEVLNRSLDDGTRMEYDYIIIDTMPALSYLTMNTLWAADAVLMPLPPEGLDIASSSQFWSMFTELAEAMPNKKTYHFIGVMPSKVDHAKVHTDSLLSWIEAGYEEFVLPVEIPASQVVSMGGTEMRTVFDITKYVGATKTYSRARDAYDKLVAEIDQRTRQTCWNTGEKS